MSNHYANIRFALTGLPVLIMLIVGIGSPVQAVAQEVGIEESEVDETEIDVNELSKELVNPVGPNWVINTFVNVNKKNGYIADRSRTAVELLLQPVMPIVLNKTTGLTLMNRPTLPILLSSPVPRTDTTGAFTEFNNLSGVGDLSLQMALGKMKMLQQSNIKTSQQGNMDMSQQGSSNMLMWGIGVNVVFPTASENSAGSGKYSAGPAGMLVGFTENYTFGVVVNQVWSYAGDSNRAAVNRGQFQMLYFKQLGGGWQMGDNPTWTFNWNADDGEKYDMPIGFGIFKTTLIGSKAWRFGITPRYYLKSSKRWGSDWALSFTITPVIKNPF